MLTRTYNYHCSACNKGGSITVPITASTDPVQTTGFKCRHCPSKVGASPDSVKLVSYADEERTEQEQRQVRRKARLERLYGGPMPHVGWGRNTVRGE